VLSLAHASISFQSPTFAVLSAGLLLSGVVHANLQLLRAWYDVCVEWLVALVDRLRPRTLAQWGVVAVMGSFLSLAIGALVSLRRPPEQAELREKPA
jgi:hypothetical protein